MGSGLKNTLGELLIKAIEKAGLDPAVTEQHAMRSASVEDWVRRQRMQTVCAGAVAGLGIATLPGWFKLGGVGIEMGAVAHKMSVLTWGVGYRIGSPVDPRLDLANVLGLWCGALPEDALVKTVRSAVVSAASKAGEIVAAHGAQRALGPISVATVGVPVLGAVSSAIAERAAADFAVQVAEKAVSGTITGLAGAFGSETTAFVASQQMQAVVPWLTEKLMEGVRLLAHPMARGAGAAAAGAAFNAWLISSVARSAITYYENKVATQPPE